MKKLLFAFSFVVLSALCFSLESFISVGVTGSNFKNSSLIAEVEQVAYDFSEIPSKFYFKIYYKNGKQVFIGNFMHPYFEKDDLKNAGADEKKYVPKDKLKQNKMYFDGVNLYMDINEKEGVVINITTVAKVTQLCPEEIYKKVTTKMYEKYICDIYEANCQVRGKNYNMKTYINNQNIKIKTIAQENDKIFMETKVLNYKINAKVDENMFKPTEGIQYMDITGTYALFANLDRELTKNYYATGSTETAQNLMTDLINKSVQKSVEDQIKNSVPQKPEDILKKAIFGW